MKQIFEIKDQEIINELFDEVEYGTLAICADNKPYSLPLNFVKIGDALYFHGAKKGKKIDILKENIHASFSVVKPYSMIQSYFSSRDGLACPATQFFNSIIADGMIEFVEDYSQKVQALDALMQKLQSEGGYKPLDDEEYIKVITATCVYKLKIKQLTAKFKFGQHLPQKRFEMIIEHLRKRGENKDKATIEVMHRLKN